MEVADFVARYLTAAPVRILEVGCGDGELALALSGKGHFVTAIDPEAPHGSIFRQVSLEQFDEPTSFHAVVANRSLHHIHDLKAALEKIGSLLRSDGILILNEFAWDQMDQSTANWYLSQIDQRKPQDASLLADNFPDAWIAEHDGLHAFAVMESHLDKYFRSLLFEWVPYIARYYLERNDLEAEEARLIRAGQIKALGFRYVGKAI
jgi:SAM-dependent methyltransferase